MKFTPSPSSIFQNKGILFNGHFNLQQVNNDISAYNTGATGYGTNSPDCSQSGSKIFLFLKFYRRYNKRMKLIGEQKLEYLYKGTASTIITMEENRRSHSVRVSFELVECSGLIADDFIFDD